MPTLRKLLCLLGRHQWCSDGDSFNGAYSGHTTTLIWWYCPHCWATKLTFIGKDGADNNATSHR